MGAGRQEDRVGLDPHVSITRRGGDDTGGLERRSAVDHRDVAGREPRGDVAGLCLRERQDAGVDRREVGSYGLGRLTPELGRRADLGQQVGGGDEGLARHAVGQHRRATEAVTLDESDLGTQP